MTDMQVNSSQSQSEKVTLYLAPDVVTELKIHAAKERKSVSQVGQEAISSFLGLVDDEPAYAGEY